MGTILFELALTCYFAATIIGIIGLFKGSKESSQLMLVVAGAGFLIHSASIVYRYISAGHLPITSMYEATSFFAWCIVLIFFFLEYRYKIGIMGSFILPIVFILMLSSSVLPRGIHPLSPVLRSYWLGIHAFLAFSRQCSFCRRLRYRHNVPAAGALPEIEKYPRAFQKTAEHSGAR